MNGKLLFTLSALLLAGWLQAAKPIKAKVDKATVYLQGAHLYYQEQVYLKPGKNEFLFENISPGIIENSLQAYSKGGTVMDVRYQANYIEAKPNIKKYTEEIARVNDSLEMLEFDLQDVNNKVYVLETEKRMLLNFKMVKGDSPKDSLPLLIGAMDFTHQRLNQIYDQSLALDKRKKKINKLQIKLQERLNTLNLLESGELGEPNSGARIIHQVVLTLFSEAEGAALVNFNYFIGAASWQPVYELHANANNGKMQVKYFAMVSQQSEIDWNQTQLTLSSSSPMEQNVKPILTPWYISLQQFVQYRKQQAMSNSKLPTMAPARVKSLKEDMETPTNSDDANYIESKAMAEYVQITENLIRTEYEIKLKYEIPSEAKQHKVMIKQEEIGMGLEFAAVPKLSADAFLMANVSGWENLNLLPGNARVYFDNGYVGETFINPQSESDTLEFNLGRDKSLVIQRRKIKDKSRTKVLESDKVETRTIEITVRNTKQQAIWINLEDQIPVAQGSNDIKITLADGSGANLHELEGKLSWRVKVNPKETKKITFTYEVRYPKDRIVYGL